MYEILFQNLEDIAEIEQSIGVSVMAIGLLKANMGPLWARIEPTGLHQPSRRGRMGTNLSELHVTSTANSLLYGSSTRSGLCSKSYCLKISVQSIGHKKTSSRSPMLPGSACG